MDLKHPGNWRGIGGLVADPEHLVVFECPLCFALTRDPMGHAEFHEWTGTEHPYTPRAGASR